MKLKRTKKNNRVELQVEKERERVHSISIFFKVTKEKVSGTAGILERESDLLVCINPPPHNWVSILFPVAQKRTQSLKLFFFFLNLFKRSINETRYQEEELCYINDAQTLANR